MKVTEVTEVIRFRVKSKNREFSFFSTNRIGVKNGNFSNLGNYSVNGLFSLIRQSSELGKEP